MTESIVLTKGYRIAAKFCLSLALLQLSAISLLASDPAVTKLVIRLRASDLAQDSLAALPKTLYFAGTQYARIEEIRDPSISAKSMIVVNEPDIWVINETTRTATHSINPGPDLTVHNPILGPDCPEELFEFEYGHELDFLKRKRAKVSGPNHVNQKECETWELELKDYRILADVRCAKKDARSTTNLQERQHSRGY